MTPAPPRAASGKPGPNIPFYVVSTASDALVGAVGLHEMGICGVFLKPVDSAIVIQTLKTRLGMN